MGATARSLAVFDLDGTISRRDTLMPYVLGWLWRHPWRFPRLLAALPALCAFAAGRGSRGQLKGALIHAALGGVPRAALAAWTRAFVPLLLARGLYAEALERIEAHRARGDRLVLMSASVDCYVPAIGAALGFAETICSPVAWRADDRLDGHLAGPNCRGTQKRRHLEQLLQSMGGAHVTAYGNSRSDLAHLALADVPVLVNARPGPLPPGFPPLTTARWRRVGRGRIIGPNKESRAC